MKNQKEKNASLLQSKYFPSTESEAKKKNKQINFTEIKEFAKNYDEQLKQRKNQYLPIMVLNKNTKIPSKSKMYFEIDKIDRENKLIAE